MKPRVKAVRVYSSSNPNVFAVQSAIHNRTAIRPQHCFIVMDNQKIILKTREAIRVAREMDFEIYKES